MLLFDVPPKWTGGVLKWPEKTPSEKGSELPHVISVTV
jgi:hypothetical protein